jgi:putative membrane protein
LEVAVLLAAITDQSDVWQFRAHPEVWLLVGALICCYVYAIRAIGPRVVRKGTPVVTSKQIACFVCGILLLWFASDWPLHDLGERHLYSAHMLQHMILSYFAPPLLLLATPEWLARMVIGDGRAYRIIRWLTKPVVAAVIFNVGVMVIHIPGLVNAAVSSAPGAGALHFSLHVMVVLTSLLMWMPVCGPLPEVQISPGGKIIYLFAQSFVPTIPAAWLTFAEGVVYSAYNHPPRVFGLSVTDDQQIAGVLMKIGGSVYLWTLCTVLFFRRFMRNWEAENSYARFRRIPDAEITGHDEETLTYDQVAEEFERTPPVHDPHQPSAGS